MRKKLIILIVLGAICTHMKAIDEVTSIDFTVSIIDKSKSHEGATKSPVLPPQVSYMADTLLFYTPCDGYELRIVNENQDEVFSMVIPSGTAQMVLPSTLNGEYELQLITGNLMFYGTIEL